MRGIKIRGVWITSELLFNSDRMSWHFNVLPAFNFGNNPGKKGCIINFAWLLWCWHIRIRS